MIVCDTCSAARLPLSTLQAVSGGDAVATVDDVITEAIDGRDGGVSVRVCVLCAAKLSKAVPVTSDIVWA